MRALTLGLVVFALGLATAALIASPRAGARATAGSLSGSVGPGFTISMSASSVTAGDYTINISDSSNIHNFHLSGPGVNESTSISGTGSTSWSVTLTAGTYSFQCDAHPGTMNGSLTVTDAATTTTDTTPTTTTTAATTTTAPTTTVATTTTAPATTTTTTTAHTTTARTTTEHTTTEETTVEETTSEATTTVAATTTASEPTVPASTTVATTTTIAPEPPAKPLKARVAAARATPTTVAITVASNEHGKALAQLFSGKHRVAKAAGRVPGRLVLRPAKPLKPGRYVLKLRVTAGGKTSTSSRPIRVR